MTQYISVTFGDTQSQHQANDDLSSALQVNQQNCPMGIQWGD